MALRKDALVKADGGLRQIGSGGYINWKVGESKIVLDGDFTIAELQWLIAHMQSKDEVQ